MIFYKTKFAAAILENNEVPVIADDALGDRFVKLVGEILNNEVTILVEAPCVRIPANDGTRQLHKMFTSGWLDTEVLDRLASAMWIASQATLKEIRASANTLEAFKRCLAPIPEGQRGGTVSFSE